MKLICMIFMLLYNSSGCLKMDIVLLGDLSGSCQGKEGFIGDAFVSIIEKLEFGEENVKLSVVTFNSWTRIHESLTGDKNEAIRAAISVKTTTANQSTVIWLGLEEALKQLYSESSRNTRKMIVLVTDAQDDNMEQTRKMVQKINGLGIVLVGVLIESSYTNEDFMKEICPYYIKSDYEQLSEEIKKLNICL